ncbi:MAG: ECF transporter S component [Nitrososphaerales archaeon]|nr:ECF transporter S component [Nitrososphaerales archaeon]
MGKYYFTTLEIVLIAVLGALLALFDNFGIAPVVGLARPLMGPFAGIIFGIDSGIAATLGLYIIRKPGVGILTTTILGVVDLLIGHSPVVLFFGSAGLGAELGFAIFKYRRWNLLSISIAAFLSTWPWAFVVNAFFGLTTILGVNTFLEVWFVRSIITAVFGGLVTKALADGLSHTGVLSSFRIAIKRSAP